MHDFADATDVGADRITSIVNLALFACTGDGCARRSINAVPDANTAALTASFLDDGARMALVSAISELFV